MHTSTCPSKLPPAPDPHQQRDNFQSQSEKSSICAVCRHISERVGLTEVQCDHIPKPTPRRRFHPTLIPRRPTDLITRPIPQWLCHISSVNGANAETFDPVTREIFPGEVANRHPVTAAAVKKGGDKRSTAVATTGHLSQKPDCLEVAKSARDDTRSKDAAIEDDAIGKTGSQTPQTFAYARDDKQPNIGPSAGDALGKIDSQTSPAFSHAKDDKKPIDGASTGDGFGKTRSQTPAVSKIVVEESSALSVLRKNIRQIITDLEDVIADEGLRSQLDIFKRKPCPQVRVAESASRYRGPLPATNTPETPQSTFSEEADAAHPVALSDESASTKAQEGRVMPAATEKDATHLATPSTSPTATKVKERCDPLEPEIMEMLEGCPHLLTAYLTKKQISEQVPIEVQLPAYKKRDDKKKDQDDYEEEEDVDDENHQAREPGLVNSVQSKTPLRSIEGIDYFFGYPKPPSDTSDGGFDEMSSAELHDEDDSCESLFELDCDADLSDGEEVSDSEDIPKRKSARRLRSVVDKASKSDIKSLSDMDLELELAAKIERAYSQTLPALDDGVLASNSEGEDLAGGEGSKGSTSASDVPQVSEAFESEMAAPPSADPCILRKSGPSMPARDSSEEWESVFESDPEDDPESDSEESTSGAASVVSDADETLHSNSHSPSGVGLGLAAKQKRTMSDTAQDPKYKKQRTLSDTVRFPRYITVAPALPEVDAIESTGSVGEPELVPKDFQIGKGLEDEEELDFKPGTQENPICLEEMDITDEEPSNGNRDDAEREVARRLPDTLANNYDIDSVLKRKHKLEQVLLSFVSHERQDLLRAGPSQAPGSRDLASRSRYG
ncbi:uncharacterized protein RCO7_00003 [Rhynchosporium graminicola]|uniref:Uncharacterized protein n=1 Tax=Rhynchosporium graminicola TaxID=2792576 RepID=A0A1E1KIM6_9HELO|nr:uncharacterized protein RCO7_00003 [Rhynchosporium commune]